MMTLVQQSTPLEILAAYQDVAIKWLGDADPSSAKDFQAVLLHSLKLFAGIAKVKQKLKDIADRPRLLAECESRIKVDGLIVPFLPTEALINSYLTHYGEGRVFEEIKFAVIHRYPMSFVAEQLARYTQNKMRQRWDSDPILRTLATLPMHPTLQAIAPASSQIPLVLPPTEQSQELQPQAEPVANTINNGIGSNTRLNAIPVEPIATVQPLTTEQTAEIPQPLAAIDTLFGATGESWRELFRDGSPSADVLTMPLHNRAGLILRCLADSGCDLMPYIGRPTLAAGGKQRSGKTTLIVLMAVLEKALGQSVFYVTLDDDVYPFAFNQVAAGSKGFWAYSRLATTVSSWGMGALKGSTWILDECTAYALQNKQGAEMLWSTALTGFAKRGGRVRIIAHAKTATGNGVPTGLADTFKSELTFLWTDRTNGAVEVDEDNQVDASNAAYTPSGRYQELEFEGASYSKTGNELIIPDWLKFAVNPNWHNAPCPVRSLLEFFPEFKATEKQTTEIKTIIPTSEPDIEPATQTETVSIPTQVQMGQNSPISANASASDDAVAHDGCEAERVVTANKKQNVVEFKQQANANLQKLAKKIQESGNEGVKEWVLLKLFRSDRREQAKLLIKTLLDKFGDRYYYDAEQEKYYCRSAALANSKCEPEQSNLEERELSGQVDEVGQDMGVFEAF